MHKYQSVSKIEIIMVILWNICVGDFFFCKVSFFWDLCQDMSSSSFLPKKQASDWLTHLVYQL